MTERRDALAAAAQAVLTIERTACGAPVHAVSTTGRIESLPGALNVVPEQARLWAELRSVDAGWLSGVKGALAGQIATEAAARGVEAATEWLTDQGPVPTTPSIQDQIAHTADELGIRWTPIPSGAGHDAAHMTPLGPLGMIFIPSRGGRSHVPEEWTDLAQIALGVHVLAATLTTLDTAG